MSLPFMQPYMGLGNSLQTAQGGAGAVGGWVELGRTTLGSAGDSISVTSLADKRYYKILTSIIPSGQVRGSLRVNNDTGSNYALRASDDGGADSTFTSQTQIFSTPNPSVPYFQYFYFANKSSKEKLAINNSVFQNTAGAANAPNRNEIVSKWANTSNSINRFDIVNDLAGDFATGSELVVLGWDPADTHTTNFWEELDSSSWSSGDNWDSGTFTAKKYLWIQVYAKGANSTYLRFNDDAGTNYAQRYSLNGAADYPLGSQPELYCGATGTGIFLNAFIINNSANEKLVITHTVQQSTAGAATAPSRFEQVGKWANTSYKLQKFLLRELELGIILKDK